LNSLWASLPALRAPSSPLWLNILLSFSTLPAPFEQRLDTRHAGFYTDGPGFARLLPQAARKLRFFAVQSNAETGKRNRLPVMVFGKPVKFGKFAGRRRGTA
jgi:hypothetical protein